MEKADVKMFKKVPKQADRIFTLIESLKAHKSVEFEREITSPWTVKFKGEASFRHANRISIFMDYLSDLLSIDLCVANARTGSVVVGYTPAVADVSYIERSEEIVQKDDLFRPMMQKLGIIEVRFGSDVVKDNV